MADGAPHPARMPLFEPAAFAGRFAQRLRAAGLPATPERSARFTDALRLMPPVDRAALYWAARLAFVTDRAHVEPFDQVFDAVLGGLGALATRGAAAPPLPPGVEADPRRAPVPSAAPPAPAAAPLPGGTAAPSDGRGTAPGGDRREEALRLLGSAAETLSHKHFAALDAAELAAVERLLTELVVRAPLRRTRRREAAARGRRIDLRRTLRDARRTGGEPFRPARTRARSRPRRLVLLCDISGSMEPYTRAYLRLFPRAAATADAEAFVFGTRLTRLTPVLRQADPDTALRRAGATASDWSGGTRIGHALGEFNDRFGRRGMARGAVVVVFSDGWESESPEAVGREMARLRRLAHRVVWVNPRKANPGYAPLAGGMAAALPHCDAFVSGHSLAALAEVVAAIAGSGPRRPA